MLAPVVSGKNDGGKECSEVPEHDNITRHSGSIPEPACADFVATNLAHAIAQHVLDLGWTWSGRVYYRVWVLPNTLSFHLPTHVPSLVQLVEIALVV